MAPRTFDNTWRAALKSPAPDNPITAPEDQSEEPRHRGTRRKFRWEFAPPDVLETRERFGATQKQFALIIGISAETLRNWESGRRAPCGPSRALLRVMRAEPEMVARVLRWHITREPNRWEKPRFARRSCDEPISR